VNGFSVHANTQIAAHRRDQLARLMRYTGRGAVSLERLTEDDNGDLCTSLPDRGPTARPVSTSRRRNCWRSWRPSCPCRVLTWSATAAVWRPTASFATRSFPHHASKVWTMIKRRLEPHIGTGRGSWDGCFIWIWPHAPFANGDHSA
jgi:hypothetical protein